MVDERGKKNKGRRALGKGLSALIPGANSQTKANTGTKEYFQCPVGRIRPDPNQPRINFDKNAIQSLVESIKEQGIIQPLIVKRTSDGYELIAGERRWRAAQLAGYKEVPVVIKEVTKLQAFEMALVENIQREDLNPIEEANAFSRLLEEHGYTQKQVATRIGRDRSTIANSLRLLKLPAEVKAMVLDGDLSEGHARAVLQAGTENAITTLAKIAIQKSFSVRKTEQTARSIANGSSKTTTKKTILTPQVKSLIERLEKALAAKVNIVDKKGKGRLEITYTSYEELDGILDKILR